MNKSRKTLMFLVGLISAIGAYIGTQAGLTIDFAAVGLGLVGVIAYIATQAKLDIAKIQQFNKWRDPKFWTALVMVIVAQLDGFFSWGLPIAEISTGVALIIGFIITSIFKKFTP